MDIQHGTWGERIRTYRTDNALITILYLKPNKRCSWHFHNTQYNQFFVIKGTLGVKTDVGPNNQRNLTKITERQSFTVRPGITHEFQTYDEPTIIEEVAYVKYDESDIHRKQLGGDLGMIDDKA
jgi:mannose-6-phosphate isomerase-like protein (cupin superfamily)